MKNAPTYNTHTCTHTDSYNKSCGHCLLSLHYTCLRKGGDGGFAGQNKVCVPNVGLPVWGPSAKLNFPLRKVFLMWVGRPVGGALPGAHVTPPPPRGSLRDGLVWVCGCGPECSTLSGPPDARGPGSGWVGGCNVVLPHKRSKAADPVPRICDCRPLWLGQLRLWYTCRAGNVQATHEIPTFSGVVPRGRSHYPYPWPAQQRCPA